MQIDVQQRHEIARIDGDDHEVVVERLLPDAQIGLA
jgi:hypothetical protein